MEILRACLRAPVVPLRELLHTPAAYTPALGWLTLIFISWWALIRRRRAESTAIEGLAFVVAALAVLWFLQFGKLPWDQEQDWIRNWRYFSSTQDAVVHGRLPYYVRSQLQISSDRFWAYPEILAAPSALLLGVMSINTFFMLHVALCFVLGFSGLVALRRELEMSPLVWSAFVLVFLFNGHITAHLSVGHVQWVSYWLLPWVFFLLIRLARGHTGFTTAAWLALTLTAILAIGGWHVFVWALLLVCLFCVSSRDRLIFLAKTLAITALLAAYRLLPAVVTVGGGSNIFALSFRNVRMLIDALAVGQTMRFAQETEGWWEFDTYVGLVGFALLCAGAVPTRGPSRYLNTFYLGILVLFALSIGNVYEWTLFRLPGFVSERVVTRIAIVPTIVLALLGCVRLDRWLKSATPRSFTVASVVMLAAVVVLVAELVLKAATWRPVALATPPPVESFFVASASVDPAYLWSTWIGLVVSLSALGGILSAMTRTQRRAHARRS